MSLEIQADTQSPHLESFVVPTLNIGRIIYH